MGNQELNGVHKKKRKKSHLGEKATVDAEVEAAEEQIVEEEGNAAKKRKKKHSTGDVAADVETKDGNATKKRKKKLSTGDVAADVDKEDNAVDMQKPKTGCMLGEISQTETSSVAIGKRAGQGEDGLGKERLGNSAGAKELTVKHKKQSKREACQDGVHKKKRKKSQLGEKATVDGEVEAAKEQIVEKEGNAAKKRKKKHSTGDVAPDVVTKEGNAIKKQKKKHSTGDVAADADKEGNAVDRQKPRTDCMLGEISQTETSSVAIGKRAGQGEDGLAKERPGNSAGAKEPTVKHKKQSKREACQDRENKNASNHVADNHGEPIGSCSENATDKTRKKVRFGDVSVLGPQGDETRLEVIPEEQVPPEDSKTNEFWNKWFTKEEDQMLKEAAYRAIESKGWTQERGLRLLLFREERKGTENKETRECWKAIGAQLPHRDPRAVQRRGRMILDIFNKVGKWSQEDHDLLKRLIEEHGQKWHKIGKILGRRSGDVRQKWRYGRNQKNRGQWKLEEMEKMCKLVHESLAMDVKLGPGCKQKPRRLDDVPWTAVADRLGTRPDTHCMRRWYDILCSSMVRHGEWANRDDHNLLLRLLESGAPDEDSVDWDKLLEHRSGELCRQRWKQMTSHLGRNRDKPFETRLELLVKRYAPCFLEDDVKPCALESSSPATTGRERHHGCEGSV